MKGEAGPEVSLNFITRAVNKGELNPPAARDATRGKRQTTQKPAKKGAK